MWNVIIGIGFIIGGLSGEFALAGTQSGGALALLGGGFVIWEIIKKMRTKGA